MSADSPTGAGKGGLFVQAQSVGVLSARTVGLMQAGLARTEGGLSGLLGAPVQINLEILSLEPAPGLSRLAGGPADVVTGIYVAFSGDLRGHCLLYLDDVNVAHLVQRLVGETADADLVQSALLEAGNITVSGLVNGVADNGGWCIQVSPPALARDMLGSLMGSVLAAASLSSPELLAVRARFQVRGGEVQGTVLLMPDAASLQALLRAEAGPP